MYEVYVVYNDKTLEILWDSQVLMYNFNDLKNILMLKKVESICLIKKGNKDD